MKKQLLGIKSIKNNYFTFNVNTIIPENKNTNAYLFFFYKETTI